MSGKRYAEELKIEAVKQVTEGGYRVTEVTEVGERLQTRSQADELQRLKAELKRVTEERDILKKAAAYFAKASR